MAYEFHRMIHIDPSTRHVDLRNGSVTVLRDTTVLIDYADIRLLFDPPLTGLARTDGQVPVDDIGVAAVRTPHRLDVPALDAMVLLDVPTVSPDTPVEEAMTRDVPLITMPAGVDVVEALAFDKVHPLSTWQWIVLRKGDASITLTALPACAQNGDGEAAMGCMVELRSRPDQVPYRIYFSGPTQLSDEVEETAYRYPAIDLGVICLNSMMRHGVMMAIDVPGAVDVACAVRPDKIIPVQRLEHIFDWSQTDFHRAMHRRGHLETSVSIERGQPFWFEVAQGPARRSSPALSRLDESPTRHSPGSSPTTHAGVLTRAR